MVCGSVVVNFDVSLMLPSPAPSLGESTSILDVVVITMKCCFDRADVLLGFWFRGFPRKASAPFKRLGSIVGKKPRFFFFPKQSSSRLVVVVLIPLIIIVVMGGRRDACRGWIGTSFQAKRWLSLDTCGSLGIALSFSIHIFAASVVGRYLIAHSSVATILYVAVYMPLTVLALWSLFMAWTTNPGAVPMGARPLVTVQRMPSGEISPLDQRQQRQRSVRRCHMCNDNYKPPRAHHDSVTGRCIVKMDHYW